MENSLRRFFSDACDFNILLLQCDLVLWKYFCTGTGRYRGHVPCIDTARLRGEEKGRE